MSKQINIRNKIYTQLTAMKNGSYSDTLEQILNKIDAVTEPSKVPITTTAAQPVKEVKQHDQ